MEAVVLQIQLTMMRDQVLMAQLQLLELRSYRQPAVSVVVGYKAAVQDWAVVLL